MDTPIPVDLGRIAQDLQIRRVQVESVVQLLDEGNTVPFITRYRKERTGGLNEVVLREIQGRVARARELAERKQTILKAIEAQGKLSEELAGAIRAAENPKRLEDLYLPYKPKKRTKASEARDKGLEPLALRIWSRDETLTDLAAAAAEFVDAEKGLDSAEKVLEGVGHILAESVSELAHVRDAVRRAVWKLGKIVTSKAENVGEGKGLDFRDYFSYTEPVAHIPPHRVLAINRGDKENVLKVKLEVPRPELERAILSQMPLEGHPNREIFSKATLDALDRLLMPSLEREVRRDLTEMAEKHAVDVFARNLRSLLLQPPIHKQTVLAIDPGFRSGCKVAVLDPDGALLEYGTIHPHQPQNRRHEAKVLLKDLVGKHKVDVVAIGNGTACRETEELISEIIAEGTHFHANPDVPFPGAKPKAPAHAPTPTEGEGEAAAPAEGEGDATSSSETPTEGGGEAVPAAVAESTPGGETPEPEPTAPAAEPPTVEAVAEANHEPEMPNGDGETEEARPEASLPPVQGGAPDDSTPPQDFPPISGGSPDEAKKDQQPPPSSMSESQTPEAEAQKAEQLEKSEQTRNPADPEHHGGGGNDIPPVKGGAPDADEAQAAEGSAADPNAPPAPSDATPIDTLPPPPPSSSMPETVTPEAEAQKADGLESSEQTQNPADLGAETPKSDQGQEEGPKPDQGQEKGPKPDGDQGQQDDGESQTQPVPQSDTDSPTTEAAPPEGPSGQAGSAPIASAEAVAAEGEVAASRAGEPAAGEAPVASHPAPAAAQLPPGAIPLTQPPRGPKPKSEGPRPPKTPRTPPPPPAPHAADERLAQLAYVIVNEAGASVYSASPVGREEFPDFDAEQRGTISIGRRLQDPLSELVKIEPQNIGVGLYQHDVNAKQLKESLESVIESCVNFVGVDLNTASVPLLQHVSGLNSATARRIFERRREQGRFTSREQIREIEGVGPITFTQAAGFLKIHESEHPLDRTWVHPESYPVAEKLLERLESSAAAIQDKDALEALRAKFEGLDIPALAKELEVGEPTLRDIVEALARPGRDPREDLPKPIFKRGVLKLEDLQAGMELKGTVLNVVDFGAFVDIGLKDSGLVHISQLANRYIKSPHDAVSVGDVVTVWVMGVDQERKRVSLTMVEPGTERPRAERGQGGGRRGPGGEGRPEGDGGRGRGPRGPRREGAPGPGQGQGQAAEGARSEAPRPGSGRIPGPPMRAQQGGTRGGGRFGGGGRGPQRGGPRPGQYGQPPAAERTVTPPRPKKPAPPPAPLSKDALTGNAPLRTFGQLKQLYETRTQEPGEASTLPTDSAPPESAPTPPPAPESNEGGA